MTLSAKKVKRYCIIPLELDDDIITKFIPIAEHLYVKELLGKPLYENLNTYPALEEECDKLLSVATIHLLSPFYIKDETLHKFLSQQLSYAVTNLKQHIEKGDYPLYRPSEIL